MEYKFPYYSAERSAFILKKLLSPESRSVPKVASEKGVNAGTLYNWLKQAREQEVGAPGSQRTSSEDWDRAGKFAVELETASMTAHELSEHCRQRGLYPEQIARWKAASIAGAVAESSQSHASGVFQGSCRIFQKYHIKRSV